MSTWEQLKALWDSANAPSGRDQVAAADAVMPQALAGADLTNVPAPGVADPAVPTVAPT